MFWGIVAGLSLAGISVSLALAVVAEDWMLQRVAIIAPAAALCGFLLVLSISFGLRKS